MSRDNDDLIGRGGDGRRLSKKDNQRVSDETVAGDQLRSFIERVERMEEEKAAVASDIKEIFAEAKGNGFDVKVIRTILKLRKMDHSERMEQEAMLELYMSAIGMATAPVDDDED